MKTLKELVYDYPTINAEGFTDNELHEIGSIFPNLDKDKFRNAFFGNTCMRINNETIHYHCDVLTALKCGIGMDIFPHEFD